MRSYTLIITVSRALSAPKFLEPAPAPHKMERAPFALLFVS